MFYFIHFKIYIDETQKLIHFLTNTHKINRVKIVK